MNNSSDLDAPIRLLHLSRNSTTPTIVHDHLGISRASALVAIELAICNLLRGPTYKVNYIVVYTSLLVFSFSFQYNKLFIIFEAFAPFLLKLLCSTFLSIELFFISLRKINLEAISKLFKLIIFDGWMNGLEEPLLVISTQM